MFKEDKWPFVPVCLSEIIDPDTLAVMEAGCCVRLGRPLTILDYDPQTRGFGHRIESSNEKQQYEEFCRLLRDEELIQGGDQTCKQQDIEQANISLRQFLETGDPFRSFECHMRLLDMTFVIRIRGSPVALVFSGQYCPLDGTANIVEAVQHLGSGPYEQISLEEPEHRQLLALINNIDPFPPDARQHLEREAEVIQRFAEATFESTKRQWEEDFLDELRILLEVEEVPNYGRLRQTLERILERVKTFCRCEYAVFFGSIQEGATVLAPLASAGIAPKTADNLPHFNWKKASLPLERFDIKAWDLAKLHRETGTRGIRGENSQTFAQAGCTIPFCHGDQYRGILVLGPFRETPDLSREQVFLTEIVSTIGTFTLIVLQVLNLERERRRWKSTANLLTHQLRTTLTPITARVGGAKALVQKLERSTTTQRAVDLLQRTEDISLQVAETARQTVEGHVVQLEREDLEAEPYPLSVLVTNCAEGFVGEAKRRHRSLVIDEDVEYLPEAEVDVARLTIALNNLIENAIKYSFPNTTIYIRASFDPLRSMSGPRAIVRVDDIGDEIRPEDQERIFEEGTRGLTEAKMGRIPGSGLGLWETRAVIEAHGGAITVTCTPTSIRRPQGLAHHVIFTVSIPVRGLWAKM
jgi:signal transduction histidine kinase